MNKQYSVYQLEYDFWFPLNRIIIASQRGALITFQRFQILLTPRMFPVWGNVVWVFARKAIFNMGWVLSIFSYLYLCSK